MTSWHNLSDERHAFEPEIQVGLHEFWLRHIPFGPTQAYRVLEQSPMLEQAHERRFVHNELQADLTNFETEHVRRVQSCLDALCHFLDCSTPLNDHIPQTRQCDDLAGLIPIEPLDKPMMPDRIEDSSLIAISDGSSPMERIEPQAPIEFVYKQKEDEIDNSSFAETKMKSLMNRFDFSVLPHPLHIPRAHQRHPENSVRQRKAVRFRREPVPCSAAQLEAKKLHRNGPSDMTGETPGRVELATPPSPEQNSEQQNTS